MGSSPSKPTGHYRAGPQYRAPPTHFKRGYTMRETQHFKGGYTLRDPPKKKKMGLVGVPDYSPSKHSSSSNGFAQAAARAAFSPPPQKHTKHGVSPRAITAYVPPKHSPPPSRGFGRRLSPQPASSPAPQTYFKHGHSLRDTTKVSSSSNSKPSRFGSRAAPQQTFSQPARQPFSHGHTLRKPAKEAKHYSTFHDIPGYKEGNCRKMPPYREHYKPSHREKVLPPLPEGHCKKRPPVQHPRPENNRRWKKSFWS
ncbi:hypothetical protein FACUT_287 [Fusarium acutatum]|uniref:Uncharacterized protein n=1 Tax=Fusarium acutatum TaxID=78861 RepID=A0A8H4K761_9HYPO|nr:hypothetical protein FACUT_287 [Fusarium acutatum]